MSDMTPEPPAPLRPTEMPWGEYVAALLGHGKGNVRGLDDATFDEVRELQSKSMRDRFGPFYLRIGEFLSSAAGIESQLATLASFLLNPYEPGRATPALKTLNARTTRELTGTLLQSRWPATSPLFIECADIARMRNQLAHNSLSDLDIDDDGTIDTAVHLNAGRIANGGYVSSRIPISTDELDAWIERANLAVLILVQVLLHLAAAQHANRAFEATMPLAIIFVEPRDFEDRTFTERDWQVFTEHYAR